MDLSSRVPASFCSKPGYGSRNGSVHPEHDDGVSLRDCSTHSTSWTVRLIVCPTRRRYPTTPDQSLARWSRALRPRDAVSGTDAVGSRPPQVVDVARRDLREAFEARVAEHVVLAVQHDPCREPGHPAEILVHLRQQTHVGRRVDPREGPVLVPVPAVDHLRRLAVLADEPRELGARIARDLR